MSLSCPEILFGTLFQGIFFERLYILPGRNIVLKKSFIVGTVIYKEQQYT